MRIAGASIMPKGHLCLWKHLCEHLNNELVVAGSFAAVQMRYNKLGSTNSYNDIDFWYNEDHNNLITEGKVESLIGKTRVVALFLLLQILSYYFHN